MRITAAVAKAVAALFAPQGFELGELRPGDVPVRVVAASLYHTDMIVRDHWHPVPLPTVLGPVDVGIVEKVGARRFPWSA